MSYKRLKRKTLDCNCKKSVQDEYITPKKRRSYSLLYPSSSAYKAFAFVYKTIFHTHTRFACNNHREIIALYIYISQTLNSSQNITNLEMSTMTSISH
ncbi:hypothetical protein CW304_14165 [Bacillus sp. UFRGS-B20]|nr:hypothetical protein CW304_14165 [Bacillus sp. UFRGS-B20]